MGCCLRKKLITVDKENADNFKDFSNIYISNYKKRNSDLKFNQVAPKPPTPNGMIKRYIDYKKSSLSTEN